jgi:hypothetical protein
LGKLSAGIARSLINPPLGSDLTGYGSRTSGCTGIHDDLHAKALVLSDGQTKAAIVTLDLLGLDGRQVAQIRADASARTGIPAGNILIGASHTHTGPATQKLRACGVPNDAYVAELLQRIALTIEEAAGHMRPAEFGCTVGEARIGVNRRHRAPDGSIQMAPNLTGTTDPAVAVWCFRTIEGRPIAVLFNHPCHAVVIGDLLEISADWPGAAQRAIEAGAGGQAMFLQGCCGNINPRERFSWEAVDKLGGEVADAVKAVLPGIAPTSDAEIAVASEVVELRYQPPPSREELEHVIADSEATLASYDPKFTVVSKNLAHAYRDWAMTILSEGGKPSVSFEVFRLSIGGSNIVSLPGEVFVEYALNINAISPSTMVSAYSNGNIGYVPTRSAFAEKGYEVDCAYKLYGEYMIGEEAEDLILGAARRLLDK